MRQWKLDSISDSFERLTCSHMHVTCDMWGVLVTDELWVCTALPLCHMQDEMHPRSVPITWMCLLPGCPHRGSIRAQLTVKCPIQKSKFSPFTCVQPRRLRNLGVVWKPHAMCLCCWFYTSQSSYVACVSCSLREIKARLQEVRALDR